MRGAARLATPEQELALAGLGLARPRALRLERCDAITDRGLHAVAARSSLTELDVSFCRSVTADGVAELAALSGLQRLYLSGGKRLVAAQSSGRKAVAAALPGCKIFGTGK